ncbi:hypothetical protein H6S82_16150 [Planktothrix sp. FACHB-1355]|uniref:Uncharacterized protein n=1 Tax=Aerosakkonema funiforme FACHB-1375 TaxID=2949571 RepID=A0A926VIQ5_9CYAN|nr:MULTISPECIES: hypothetical protein [Oscillatoriales]MBD2184592.1 hypothetical protein [Aerosakkonema funiforme FACHB-1375]MBD3560373.1 hypothetical protein [Planktothrix sp. FACHB-1355]
MSEAQNEQPNVYTPVQSSPLAKVGEFMSNWKIKAGLIGTALISLIIGVFVFNFFWSHIVAGMGMKDWSKRAGAAPIECMIKDTNDDGYVSCSAMLRGEVVPLECGSSIFNIGCRVNYGAAAAPQVRPIALPNNGGRS